MDANSAWLKLLLGIVDEGRESAPRGLRIKEKLCNTVVVDMTQPIVTVKARKMGYCFMAAEAWCIITGRNDVSSIKPYSPHIASFSNDGYRFDGAYGPRVVDQLRYIIDSLSRDPDSRQAVIEIWRPNPRDSKDIPCLDGDTLIPSPEGNITINALSKLFDAGLKQYPVFSFDTDSRRIELAYCTKVWSSGIKERIKITFDDNSFLIATPNHVLYKKTRRHAAGSKPYSVSTFIEEVRADSLQVNDHVWATHFLKTGPQSRPAFVQNLSIQTNRKITSIERLSPGEVFDFTVPGFNNAVTGTGVIAHNCTLTVQWMIREGRLHCFDSMRSSDAWLGFPYDCFNFSTLSLYILLMLREHAAKATIGMPATHVEYPRYARLLGLQLGSLFLTAGSSHLYVDPKLDGATNIPYSIKNVEALLSSDLATIKYNPLRIEEFKSPNHFVEHLDLCKRRMGTLDWMKELY